jgi:TonB family protein
MLGPAPRRVHAKFNRTQRRAASGQVPASAGHRPASTRPARSSLLRKARSIHRSRESGRATSDEESSPRSSAQNHRVAATRIVRSADAAPSVPERQRELPRQRGERLARVDHPVRPHLAVHRPLPPMTNLTSTAAALLLVLAAPSTFAQQITPPMPIESPAATAPAGATSGAIVGLLVTVGTDGSVQEAIVDVSGGASFDTAAVEAVRRWRFRPALRDGVPFAARVRIPFRFVPEGALSPTAPAAAATEAASESGAASVSASGIASEPAIAEVNVRGRQRKARASRTPRHSAGRPPCSACRARGEPRAPCTPPRNPGRSSRRAQRRP